MKNNDLKLLVNTMCAMLFIVTTIVLISWKPSDRIYKILLDVALILYFTMLVYNVITYFYSKHHHSSSFSKFINIFNAFEEGLIILDNQNNVLFVSDKLEDLFGISRRIISDGPIYDVNGIDLKEEILSDIRFKSNVEEYYKATIFNKRLSKNMYVGINLHELDFPDTQYYIIMIDDLTNTQEQMETLSKQLVEAKEIAEQKTTFLSRVSHEIRTPLNGIIGMNQISKEALEKNNIEMLKESIEKVDISSKYLLLIINNVLNMSRIESGKVKQTDASFSVNRLIDEIKVVIGSQIKEKKQHFTSITNFDNLYVHSDETKLTQVIVNIISNSIKYTPEQGKILLSILSKDLINDKVELTISVKDNGIGMSKDFAKHMFEPFTQENKVTNVPSTGLGLAITKSLIDLLNGKISVDTEEGKGTTTTMVFIMDKVKSLDVEIQREEEYSLVDYSKYRVLVAEDNTINQMVIKNHLSFFKFNVEIANDGEEALEKYRNSDLGYYDFILMDIHMPKMDGYEATNAIRNIERSDNDLPIIALTADALNEDVSKALINKMNNHISKPVVREKMIKTIYETLKKLNKLH